MYLGGRYPLGMSSLRSLLSSSKRIRNLIMVAGGSYWTIGSIELDQSRTLLTVLRFLPVVFFFF